MKVWSAVYHPQGFIVLTTDEGETYLDGTRGVKVSGEREAGKKRSGEVATPPPLSVKKVTVDPRQKTCPLCDGKKTPKTIPSLSRSCDFCWGHGTVNVCPRCGGMYRFGGKCLICVGKGLETCPDCDGFGEQLLGVICKTCNGTGRLTKRRNPLK